MQCNAVPASRPFHARFTGRGPGLLLLGVYSRISALQEFCAIACVSVLCDFVLEIVLYVAVLSLDIRRVELSDFSRPWFMKTVASAADNNDGQVDLQASTNPNSVARAWKDPKFSPAMANNLGLIICGIGTVVLALLGGVSTSGSKAFIPNMLVDWRRILIGPGIQDAALIEFIPYAVSLTLDTDHHDGAHAHAGGGGGTADWAPGYVNVANIFGAFLLHCLFWALPHVCPSALCRPTRAVGHAP